MLKKGLLILFILFSILFISNVCFATNTANNVKNAIGTGTNTVVDGMSNLAGGVRNGIGHVENGIEDALTMDDMETRTNNNVGITTDSAMTTNTGATATNGGYTATRTATTGDGAGLFGIDTSTMWVWIIVALASIVIVGLVWYYGAQNRVD